MDDSLSAVATPEPPGSGQRSKRLSAVFLVGALLFGLGVGAATLGLLARAGADDDRARAEAALAEQGDETLKAEEAVADAQADLSRAQKARRKVTRAGGRAIRSLESFLALQRAQAQNIRDVAALNAAQNFGEAARLSDESAARADRMVGDFDAVYTAVQEVSGAADG